MSVNKTTFCHFFALVIRPTSWLASEKVVAAIWRFIGNAATSLNVDDAEFDNIETMLNELLALADALACARFVFVSTADYGWTVSLDFRDCRCSIEVRVWWI